MPLLCPASAALHGHQIVLNGAFDAGRCFEVGKGGCEVLFEFPWCLGGAAAQLVEGFDFIGNGRAWLE